MFAGLGYVVGYLHLTASPTGEHLVACMMCYIKGAGIQTKLWKDKRSEKTQHITTEKTSDFLYNFSQRISVFIDT